MSTKGRSAIATIVVGVDGSENSARALEWSIRVALQTGAEVIAAYSIDLKPPPVSPCDGPLVYSDELEAGLRHAFEEEWCAPLRRSAVKHRTEVGHGPAARWISDVAERSGADLVVVGRRGRGTVAELLLGSVSHELAHECRRPVVIISAAPDTGSAGADTSAAVEEWPLEPPPDVDDESRLAKTTTA